MMVMHSENLDLKIPALELAFRACVTVGIVLDIGVADHLRKRIFPITGGTFSGPRLRGVVLPGGADWQTVNPDGTARIFARYTLKVEDGTLVSVTNPGIRRGPADILQRIATGEAVDPSLYYFRTTPSFEVAEGPHHWLAESIFVCNALRCRDEVTIDFFRLT
jgi:Protein of unknown function (DUF3237)